MADTTALKNRICAAIKANNNQEITGPVLQQTLLDIVDELALNSAIESEAEARQRADVELGGRIDNLQTVVNSINTKLAEGYIYAGIATPSTNPGIPNGKVFYIAVQAGTYTNFGNIVVAYGINILKYNSTAWSKDVIFIIDNEPTFESNNLVKSGGVKKELCKQVYTTTGTTSSSTPNAVMFDMKAGVKYFINYKTGTAPVALYSQHLLGLWQLTSEGYVHFNTPTGAEMLQGVTVEYTPTLDGGLYIRTYDYPISYEISVFIEYQNQIRNITEEKIFFSNSVQILGNGTSQQRVDVITIQNTELANHILDTLRINTGNITTDMGNNTLIQVNFFNKNGTYIYRNYVGANSVSKIQIPEGAYTADIRFYTNVLGNSTNGYTYKLASLKIWLAQTIEGIWERLQSDDIAINSLLNVANHWKGKNVVIYGDSIAAQGNGDNPGTGSFFYWAKEFHQFANLYQRGVGGQTYQINSQGWYTAVGTNGNYLNRYKFDAQGHELNEVVNPATITQQEITNIENHYGKTIEIHYGAFCLWDRITAMIPQSIKDTIDLIIISGGHNGFNGQTDDFLEPEWVPNSVVDSDWAADTTYYKGGDYDVETLAGAIASTIMKMQVWCPNAVVLLATPFPYFDMTSKQQKVNSDGVTFRRLCEIEMFVAENIGADIIDANGKCNINGVNFTGCQQDGLHPNLTGRKMYGRVFVNELNRIGAKI